MWCTEISCRLRELKKYVIRLQKLCLNSSSMNILNWVIVIVLSSLFEHHPWAWPIGCQKHQFPAVTYLTQLPHFKLYLIESLLWFSSHVFQTPVKKMKFQNKKQSTFCYLRLILSNSISRRMCLFYLRASYEGLLLYTLTNSCRSWLKKFAVLILK